MKKHTWHELFQGELTDAPGRCESWTDELCYLGNEEWIWRVQSTDFTGLEEKQPDEQKWSSESLVEFILERDFYELESPTYVYGYIENLKEQGLDSEVLGPRTLNLRGISNKVGSKHCFEKINQYEQEAIDKLEDDFEEEDEVELTKHEKLEQTERLKIYKEKTNLINRLVKQYEAPKLGPGSGGAQGAAVRGRAYRTKLFDYIEDYYDKNKKTPLGIHMIAGVDQYMREPIGFIDFDELELRAKTEEEFVFNGSLIEGLDVDLVEISGLKLTDEEIERIWGNISPRDLIVDNELWCEEIELHEIDEMPGQSDSYYEYRCGNYDEFVVKLKEWFLQFLSSSK